MRTYLSLFFVAVIVLFSSCNKQNVITDSTAMLTLKTDTLTFDTVFTTIGSTTLSFKIHNEHSQSIQVSSIDLAGGDNSQFRLNINGASTNNGVDYTIAANDSMYIHVEVTVDPNEDDLPYIVKDSVLFTTNGNTQKMLLIAYGQNANYFNSQIINDTIWTADKPYLIYNSILIDSGQTLVIEEGCQLHFHKYSRLYVKGTLVVKGTETNPVVFKHDRLETLYEDVPGQWDGIHFLKGSNQSYINYGIIENSVIGIRVDSLPGEGNGAVQYNSRPAVYDSFLNTVPNVLIENSIIRNVSNSGIIGITAIIEARNSLIYNCGQNNVQLEFGGIYDFDFCTFVNMQTNIGLDHKQPVVRMANYLIAADGIQVAQLFDANFTHCIVYGGLDDEVEIDSIPLVGAEFKYVFSHSLIKRTENLFDSARMVSVIDDEAPLFLSNGTNDYSLQDLSPCIDAGHKNIGAAYFNGDLKLDLSGNTRLSGVLVDMGAFEKQQ